MGRFVAGEFPELDRLVAETLAALGREIAALRVPALAGVVLGGGYGRGEGGAKGKGLSNDLDFFAVTEEGATDADAAAVAQALEPLSRRWSEKLGIDVDFTGRTPWRLRHDQERLMVQELVHGYVDVAGERGERLFAGIARRAPSELPWMEAARLLMNRGMGLLLAGESADRGFVNRNLNKCILGAGDARLVSRGAYRWRAVDRADALGDALYRAAVGWKFRPADDPVCGPEAAREAWLAAYDEVMAAGARAGARARSLRQAARWVVRRRTLGSPASLGRDCTVRVLEGVARTVRARARLAPALRRDWETFN